jgi:hypothetical protein
MLVILTCKRASRENERSLPRDDTVDGIICSYCDTNTPETVHVILTDAVLVIVESVESYCLLDDLFRRLRAGLDVSEQI